MSSFSPLNGALGSAPQAAGPEAGDPGLVHTVPNRETHIITVTITNTSVAALDVSIHTGVSSNTPLITVEAKSITNIGPVCIVGPETLLIGASADETSILIAGVVEIIRTS